MTRSAWCCVLLLAGCAHHQAPLHVRWSMIHREPPPDVLGWHNPIQVALVVDGRTLDVAHGSECQVASGWIGSARPLANVHCRYLGPGELNVGVFREAGALVVRVQSWEPTDAEDEPPQISEREPTRVAIAPERAIVFDP